MADYSEYFKNEPSPYVWLHMDKLKQSYVCVKVGGYPAEGQVRFAFWVVGDGCRTMFYFTSGLAEILQNSTFSIQGVVGAKETKIIEGRLKYLIDEGSEWKDLGPMTKDGRLPTDSDLESMRRLHLKNKEASVYDEEEKKQLKKALKNDLWSKGGGF